MIEKSLKVLNDILNDFSISYKYYVTINENSDIGVLKNEIEVLLKIVSSENSKLLLFDQLINEFLKDKNPTLFNYYVHESRSLLNEYPFKNFIYGSWHRLLENTHESDLNYLEDYSMNYVPFSEKDNQFISKIEKSSSVGDLKQIYFDIISWYAKDIDMLAYYSFKIRNPKVDGTHIFSTYDSSNEYIMKWIDATITLDIWRQYPNTNFLHYIMYSYDPDFLVGVGKKQLQLYKQALDIELKSLKQNITDSSTDVQKINVARQLNLIQKFTKGDFSNLDYQRLSQIIVFDRPDEVILAYDDIIRFDIYDYTKLLPYDGPNLRKSPRFVSDLLIVYEKFLIEQLEVLKNAIDPKAIEDVKKPMPKNFGFNKPPKKGLLKDVLQQLQFEYELIDSSDKKIDDLVDVLLSNDYSTIPFKINIYCKTNLFTYIIKEIKYLFNNLNAITIQSSKLFYTNNGKTLLTETNFNKSSNSLNTQKKEEIDKVLIQLKK